MLRSMRQIKPNLNPSKSRLNDGQRGFIANLRESFGDVSGKSGRGGLRERKDEGRILGGKIEILKRQMAGVMQEFAVYNRGQRENK